MPKLPWSNVSDVPSDTDVTIMGSRLPLRSYRHVPRFLWATQRIRRQLARSEGLVGYALEAELTRKTFWTVSAWVGEDVLQRFNRADPHHAETAAIKPMMLPTTFVFWAGKAGDLPVDWADVRARIDARRSAAGPDAGPDPDGDT
ncbi:MAG TPA: hypothetical protein VE623_12565 [Acidimicrobiales bacterium]|jgi:hypothetical protein|nr:hypothetical protein [Acidimicrobiales bacterium]